VSEYDVHSHLYTSEPPIPSARCLAAKAWEDRPTVLRQIDQIGEKS